MKKYIGLAVAIGIVTMSLAAAAVANATDAESNEGPAQIDSYHEDTLGAVDSIPTVDELLANAGDIVVLPSGQEVPRYVLESFATPSLCDGVHVGRSSAMSATLEARGLSHRIPADAADGLGVGSREVVGA